MGDTDVSNFELMVDDDLYELLHDIMRDEMAIEEVHIIENQPEPSQTGSIPNEQAPVPPAAVPVTPSDTNVIEMMEIAAETQITTVPQLPEKSRFKRVTSDELNSLKDNRQSEATRKNTKWALKIFQGADINK